MKQSINQIMEEWKIQKITALNNVSVLKEHIDALKEKIKNESGQKVNLSIAISAAFDTQRDDHENVPAITSSGIGNLHNRNCPPVEGISLQYVNMDYSPGDWNDHFFWSLSKMKKLNEAFSILSPHDLEKVFADALNK